MGVITRWLKAEGTRRMVTDRVAENKRADENYFSSSAPFDFRVRLKS